MEYIVTDGTGFTSEDICGGNGLKEFCDDVSNVILFNLIGH